MRKVIIEMKRKHYITVPVSSDKFLHMVRGDGAVGTGGISLDIDLLRKFF